MHIQHSTIINQPVAHVVAFATDLRWLPAWNSMVMAAKPLVTDVRAVGARYWTLSKVPLLGQQSEVVWELISCEPNRALTVKSISALMPTVVQCTFSPVAAGTRLEAAVAWQRGIAPTAEPLMTQIAQRQLQHDLFTLKHLLEHPAIRRVIADFVTANDQCP